MFKSKKSQIVISIFFLFCVNFVSAYFVHSYGQNKKDSYADEKSVFSEKPKIINLEPDKKINYVTASDNDQKLYVSELDGLINCFDVNSAEKLWTANLGGKTSSNLIETEDSLYVVTSTKVNDEKKEAGEENKILIRSVLWVIDKKFGITTDRTVVSGDSDFYLHYNDKRIYLVNNSRMTVYDKKLTKFVDEYVFEKMLIKEPLYDTLGKCLYLIFEYEIVKIKCVENKLIYEKIISFKKGIRINSFASSVDTYFVGDTAGNFYAYRISDKTRIWKFRAGGKISDIEVFEDKIIISSDDNFIYCLKKSDGNVVWKKRLPGRIAKIEKATTVEFFVRSIYSPNYYLIDLTSGYVIAQYVAPENLGIWEFRLQITSRLIMIVKINSIDIYKNNLHNQNREIVENEILEQ